MAGHSIEAHREIIGETADVWAVITDLERLSKVLGSVERVERVSGVGFDVGVRWRETRRMFGKTETEEMWVTECEPPSRAVVVSESGGARYETEYVLQPSSLGTRLRITFGAETANANTGQKLAWAVLGRVGAKATKTALEHDLADIAAAVESHPPRR